MSQIALTALSLFSVSADEETEIPLLPALANSKAFGG